MREGSPVVSAPAGVRGGAEGRGDRDDPKLDLKPPGRTAPRNGSNGSTESFHLYTGRNPGAEKESDASEVTQHGRGSTQQAPQDHSGRDSGVWPWSGGGGLRRAFCGACFLRGVSSTFLSSPFSLLLSAPPPSLVYIPLVRAGEIGATC